jgi:SSS family solute:Na+ symporter
VAAGAAFAASIVVGTLVTFVSESKPEAELRGLVWRLTPKEDITHTDEPGAPWYQKPVPLAGVALALVLVLNLLFW